MPRAADLRPIPRFALRRIEAAASIGVSPTKFDEWEAAGKMPRGRKIDGVKLYDAEEVRLAWLALRDQADGSDAPNPWDN